MGREKEKVISIVCGGLLCPFIFHVSRISSSGQIKTMRRGRDFSGGNLEIVLSSELGMVLDVEQD